jgi:hypothetical protein
VLVELGASVPSRGLYVTEPELTDLDKAVAKWAEAAVPLITAAPSDPPARVPPRPVGSQAPRVSALRSRWIARSTRSP